MVNDQVNILFFQSDFVSFATYISITAVYKGFQRRPCEPFLLSEESECHNRLFVSNIELLQWLDHGTDTSIW